MQHKAQSFIKEGFLRYHAKDFFHQPPLDLSQDEYELLLEVCTQIVDGLGNSVDNPIETYFFRSLEQVAQLCHFQVEEIEEDSVLLQHIVNPQDKTRLFFVVQERSRLLRTLDMNPPSRVRDVYPILQYRPVITSSSIVDMGRIRDCFFHLHMDCVVPGSIIYRYILECIDPAMRAPCFVVSYEQTTVESESCFFCSFEPSKHSNMGSNYRFTDVQSFAVQALKIAEKYLAATNKEIRIET
jgi:hypothetical protein